MPVRGVAGDVAPKEADGNHGLEAQRIELNGDVKRPNSSSMAIVQTPIATTTTATKTESTIYTISEHPQSPHPCGFSIVVEEEEKGKGKGKEAARQEPPGIRRRKEMGSGDLRSL
ncbi:hypothetical protein RHMOL_Rhmol09G0169500 [Rhododendron molle]|uniref:Uncharacterized protein n=1 Tax=Rhododendron molle TaxID=49168 RepID=A0ACC0MET6_RHOML|nr:hypothetical protein RHMOL_Rhmol09G0169500 [Rhododendron molle]